MNIIDSSFWLEYFAGTDSGNIVSAIIEITNDILIPAITLYEVFKKLLLETTEDDALFCIAHMKQGKIVNLNDELSLLASKLSIEFKLPMADSIIYATNLKYNCVLWTQDRHFSGLDFVRYFEKIIPQ
ncbi:MAG: type II toxin-antitoxin system VapC family toxin [Spirochaetaceae bacterium]|jgi:predicted nucleic acid-binding protein|nr:type II toxin-antitoxin system VapC family toxin [Spirochaetaceae bacterium]